MILFRLLCPLAALSAVILTACERSGSDDGHAAALRLAVTTSTRDTGLLDVLVAQFERQEKVRVDVIAVGTGKALKLGERGDVDVLLVHAQEQEEQFLAAGHGVRREQVMFNHFVLLGPACDPAGARGLSAVEALGRIAAGGHPFVSRADSSGTHRRELMLWEKAGGRPQWREYIESGRGMGAALVMANELDAYILADEGTSLAFKMKITLESLAVKNEDLLNPYSVIAVNPTAHERINEALADAFVNYLISAQAQDMIADFSVAGRQLFHPLRRGEPQDATIAPAPAG
jgi:tungstate transport system substrate-binding protein